VAIFASLTNPRSIRKLPERLSLSTSLAWRRNSKVTRTVVSETASFGLVC
jgi:hypothetical protein